MFINVPMLTGEQCLVAVSKIAFIETVGPHHQRRGDYDALQKRIETGNRIQSILCLCDGDHEYTVATTASVGEIERKLQVSTKLG